MGALLLALWGSETRLEYSLQTYIAIEVFAAITILVFTCERVISLFRGGEVSARCLEFILILWKGMS